MTETEKPKLNITVNLADVSPAMRSVFASCIRMGYNVAIRKQTVNLFNTVKEGQTYKEIFGKIQKSLEESLTEEEANQIVETILTYKPND